MARKSSSNSRSRRMPSMAKMKRTARNSMTAPNLMAAGALALGAAAFAYLRDGNRRSNMMAMGRRWRDEMAKMARGTHAAQTA